MGAKDSKIDNNTCLYKCGSYPELKKYISPFDLMLFRNDGVATKIITAGAQLEEGASLSEFEHVWTHVGIVITKDILPLPELEDRKLYIYESTINYGAEVKNIYGGSHFGVQVRDLEQVIAKSIASGGLVGWAKLKDNKLDYACEVSKTFVDSMALKFSTFYIEHFNAMYELPCCLAKAVLPPIVLKLCCFCTTRDEIFCSELVTRVYQLIGAMDSDIDAESISPNNMLQQTSIKFDTVFLFKQ